MKKLSEYKKGEMVHYEDRLYPLQDNGKNSLHIVYWGNGRREKVGLKKVLFGIFEPGSEQDYIFNGRFLEFETQQEYSNFIHQ